MGEVQTTLLVKKIPKLEEFNKGNKEPLIFLLSEYEAWKDLKQKKGVVVEVSEP